MKKLKLFFACLLMAVLSIGQMWALTNSYTIVTAVDQLSDDDIVVIAQEDSSEPSVGVTGGTVQSSTTTKKDATVSNTESEWKQFTVIVTTNGWYLSDGTNFIGSPAANTFYLTTVDNCKGVCSVGENGVLACNGRYLSQNSTYYRMYTSVGSNTPFYVWKVTTGGSGSSDPSLSASPTSLAFGKVEQNASVAAKTFTLTGSNLTDANVVSLSAPAGYTVSPTSVTPSSGSVSQTITVTPVTTNTGTFDGNITISSSDLSADVTVGLSMTVEEAFDGLKLTFDFVTHPEDWPAVKADAAAGNYIYTISATDYTFAHSKVGDGIYCTGTSGTNGALLMASGNTLGLPAISGYKLVKVEGTLNSAGTPSTSSQVAITDGTDAVTGGAAQTWDTKGEAKTYTLSGTSAATMYYMAVSNKNCQMMTLVLYYEEDTSAPKAATPTFPTGDEHFLTSTSVTLSCTTEGATIYYTINGDEPTSSSTLYEGAIPVSSTTTIKAIAVAGGYDNSNVAEKTFTKGTKLTVAAAIALIPNANDTQDNQFVEGYVCTAGTSVSSGKMTYYISADGSETDRLQIYKGKNLNNTNFTNASDLELGDRVVVFGQLKNYNGTPEMNDGNYLVSKEAPAVAAPVFSPDGGGFMGETDVTITCATASSAIYYTLDGTTPTKSSSAYSEPIHINATTTITAIAYVGDDASLVIAKTFTLTAPMTVAEALAALATESPINNAAVSGIISTAPTSNPSSGKLTYYISDDGSASDELEVYKGFGVAGASFSDKTDLQVGDVVTVFGNLTIYNTTKEFAEGNRLLAFNRPVVPSISADPVAVDAAAHASQSLTITYENWGTVNVADADATLFDDADCTIAFSGEWISNISFEDPYSSVSVDIAANTGAARTAYMKIYALGDDATTEAVKVIAISQEAYVAPAQPAELPFAFDGGRDYIASKQGMSQEGLDTDYGSSPKLKFNSTGDYVVINIASAPGKLTYDIKGNSFSGGTFKVQESANGEDYTDVATYTELGETQSEEQTLAQTTRFVKFIYTTKDGGNVALGNIAIAAYVAPPAVEAPTFSPAGGAYTGTQSVTITCATGGATIYYTTNGDDPTDASNPYTAAISVEETMTIKAIAYVGEEHSEIASATYTITAPLTDYYQKVASGAVAEGTYLIVYETGSLAFNGGAETLDASSNTIAVDITNENKIGVTQATAAATFYIDPTAGTIQAANGKYIGQGSDANGLAASDNALTNTLSIDENGDAVIVSAGGAYLRYNTTSGQERFRYFKSSSYTNQQAIQLYKLANEVIKDASGLAWDPAEDITLTVGEAFTAPTLLNPKNIPAGDITIASSNTAVATVSEGVVSLVENATGSTTITATYTGETYKPITVSYKIKVNPTASIYVNPSLNVNFGSVEKDAALPADKTITVTLNNVASATAVLGGTNPEAFSIDPATLTESGTITISVVSSATVANYSATLTISDEAGVAEAKVVNLSFAVTDAAPSEEETPVSTTSKWVPATEIVDGMTVLITGVKNDDVYAMGGQAKNNRSGVAGTLEAGVLTPGENTMAFTLVATGAPNTYYIKTSNNQYLYNASTSGNSYLKTKAEQENVSWTITLDAENNAVIESVENTDRQIMRFNYNGGSTLFNCYATGQDPVKFYVPYVAPTYVAQIGEIKYESLPAAVAAAQDGETIELLMDAAGPGVMITSAEHKQIIIDFGKHTYCANSPVGSAGTQNQAFHFEKDCNITLQNGTITSSGDEIIMLIQNYGDLTLKNITLLGDNLPGEHRYVLSNNCGTVVIGAGTTITAKEGDVAFDVCVTNDYPKGTTVTVKEGATITGIVEYHVLGSRPAENKATLTIEGGELNVTWNVDLALAEDAKDNINVQGGTFNAEVPADYCAPGYIPEDNGSGQYGVHYAGYYERGSLTPGNYATICLPNGGKISGAKLFDVEYFDGTSLYLLEVNGNTMVAGRPYIFLPSVDKIKVIYTDAAGASAGSFNGLVGSLSLVAEVITPDAGNYILLNNEYWYVNSLAYVGANRAYIHMADVPNAPSQQQGAPRRRVAMDVHGQQVATGMDQVQGDKVQSTKVLIDGQLFIIRGEKMYNANGQLVK